MTTDEKLAKVFLYVSLFICLLLLADTYLLPYHKTFTTIGDVRRYSYRSRYGKEGATFELEANDQAYKIGPELYYAARNGDTIAILNSAILQGPVKIAHQHKDKNYIYNEGYINARLGRYIVPGLIALIIIALFTLRYFYYPPSKRKIGIILLVISAAQILYFFGLLR